MYLGLDIGTSAVKGLLLDSEARVVATASAPLTISHPQPGWSEQRPEGWWKACDTVVKTLGTKAKTLEAVEGIGLSGQQHGATLLEKNGDVLRPAILWNDARAFEECTELETREPNARQIAGNIPLAGFTSPKLMWVRKYEPRTFEKVAMVLLPKDYVRFRMTGEFASDMSDSAGTFWLDVGNRAWSDALLAASSMRRDQMPALYEGTQVTGRLTASVARKWGMKNRPVVAGGAGDNAAAACGLGTVTPGSAFISIGTSGVIFVSNDRFLPNPARAIHAFCHAVPNAWHQMGVILSAAGSLEWLAGVLGTASETLSASLGNRWLGPSATLFLPYLSGERTPIADARIRGLIMGLSLATDSKEITRGVMEGVAFAFRDSLDALKTTGTGIPRLTAVGGGSRSELWLKIISTVLGVPIDVPASGDFGSAFGAARLGLIAATGVDYSQVCTPPRITKTIEPEIRFKEAYEAQYSRYAQIYPAIKEINR